MTEVRRPDSVLHARASCVVRSLTLGLALFAGRALGSPTQGAPQSHFPLSVEGARDASGEGQVFLECALERTTFYVHEPIRVRLRFGFEQRFASESLLPLFRPPMDLPVQLQAAWLADLPGAIARAVEAQAGANAAEKSFVLNDDLARAREVDARTTLGLEYRVFEFERVFLATAAGELTLPPALLRFAFATRFDDGFLDERIPADRTEAFVLCPARTLTIVPLPEQDRPPQFCGAVGSLTLRSEVSAHELEWGSSLKLRLLVSGSGNLELFDMPRLDSIDGWRVLGSTEIRSSSLRTIEYDIAPRSADVQRVPSIGLAVFDTTPPACYRVLRSEPLEVRVIERARPQDAPANVASGTENAARAPARPPWPWIGAAALGLFAAGLLGRRIASKRRKPSIGERPTIDTPRLRAAIAALREHAQASDADLMLPFAEYLGARLGVAPSSVLDPGLEARLIVAGVPRELALRTQTWIASLVAARYGGGAPTGSTEQAGGLLRELEAAFGTPTNTA